MTAASKRRRMNLPALLFAALWTCYAARFTDTAAAQPPTVPDWKPVPTTPTSPEKIKALKPLPRSIVGYDFSWWELAPPIKESPAERSMLAEKSVLAEEAEIAAIADGIVTIRKLDKTYHDVVIAKLTASTQQTLARVERLLHDKPAADEKELLGSWRLIEQTRNGSNVQYKLGAKLVITGTGLYWPGSISSQPWRIDVKTTPKSLDFGSFLPQAALPAIYELRGNELRICTNDQRGPARPKSFDRLNDEQTYCVFRRLPNLKDLPPPNPKDLDAELVATIRELVGHIEAGRTKEAMHRMFPASHLAKFSPEVQDDSLKFFEETKDHVLLALKAMLRLAPKLNADRTRADFDFSHVHLDDFEDNGAQAAFEKVDGRWYLVSEEPPQTNAPENTK